MRRLRRVAVVLAATSLGACTTFDFPPPSGAAGDDAGPTDATTSADVTADASPDTGAPSFLDVTTAARLCALTFQCPGLAAAIEASLVIPLDTPTTPLNFSGCIDWLAGPVDPGRVGLTQQRTILQTIAGQPTCAGAYASCPAQPASTSTPCTVDGCADSELLSCTSAGSFAITCGAPLFSATGSCVLSQVSGVGLCVTEGTCSSGLSCAGAGNPAPTLVDCYKDGDSYTAYDCTLSGRECDEAAEGDPDCVAPGKDTAPCPDRLARDACDTGGTSVIHCAGGVLAETELDCAATGRACSTTSGVARCVDPSTDQCTPFLMDGTVNACVALDAGGPATAISLCIGGRKTSFDCASIDLSCQPSTDTQTAHCG
jgi:hypothetical protein